MGLDIALRELGAGRGGGDLSGHGEQYREGFKAHPWSLAAWAQRTAPLLTAGVTLGQMLNLSEPVSSPEKAG